MDDTSILARLRSDLAVLTALHAPSGAEQPVIAYLRDQFMSLSDGVAVDHMGNLTATRAGPLDGPHIVGSTHADELGMTVASIEPAGFLRLAALGLVPPA